MGGFGRLAELPAPVRSSPCRYTPPLQSAMYVNKSALAWVTVKVLPLIVSQYTAVVLVAPMHTTGCTSVTPGIVTVVVVLDPPAVPITTVVKLPGASTLVGANAVKAIWHLP